jgi:thiol-disulfide isomerase/thioredoxin
MGKKESVEKVVDFEQTAVNTKTFRLHYPVSEELRRIMVSEVFRDFMIDVVQLNYDACLLLLNEFAAEHDVREEKWNDVLHNIFWCKVFYDSNEDFWNSCIADFIYKNNDRLKNTPILISWLETCAKAVPKFYFIGHKYNDRVFVAIDILDEKPLNVIVYDPLAVSPKKGEIAAGLLIPLGDGLYFPIVDFYHFDFEAREAIANCFHFHYDKYLKINDTPYDIFLNVFSTMLQIEGILFKDNQKNDPQYS